MLRLAVPSDGALHDPSLLFLKSSGMGVSRRNLRRYTAEIPSLPGVAVHFQRGSDIAMKVEEGSAELGLVGLARFLETRREGGGSRVVIDNLGFGQAELALGVPDSWVDVSSLADLADLAVEFRAKGTDLRIATKYPRLVERFLLGHGVAFFTLVQSNGTLEAAPEMGYADIIADISSTGTTMRANRLKTIAGGSVVTSEACLIGNGALLAAGPEKLVECVPRVANHWQRFIGCSPADRVGVDAGVTVGAPAGLVDILDAKLHRRNRRILPEHSGVHLVQ